jgi:hypothetical protein
MAVLCAVVVLGGCGGGDSGDAGRSTAADGVGVMVDAAQRARVRQLAQDWSGEVDFTAAWSPSGVQAARGDRPQYDPNDPFYGLPRTDGYMLVHANCIPCHETRLLMAQQQTESQWQGVLDLMIDKHGMVAPQPVHRRQIVDYLSRHFGR